MPVVLFSYNGMSFLSREITPGLLCDRMRPPQSATLTVVPIQKIKVLELAKNQSICVYICDASRTRSEAVKRFSMH